jgi:hypothetical protein
MCYLLYDFPLLSTHYCINQAKQIPTPPPTFLKQMVYTSEPADSSDVELAVLNFIVVLTGTINKQSAKHQNCDFHKGYCSSILNFCCLYSLNVHVSHHSIIYRTNWDYLFVLFVKLLEWHK